MCYHYSRFGKSADTQREYGLKAAPDPVWDVPEYHINGFQHPICPVILQENPDELKGLRWGLIPFFIKTEEEALKIRSMTLNARADTVFSKPSFRAAIKKRRCIIPSDGFFEWHTRGTKKYPFFISPKPGKSISFGGIYEEWGNPQTGEIIQTFSIITTHANALMAKIHNEKERMPLILNPNQKDIWLDTNQTTDSLTELMKPASDDMLQAWPISKLISSRSQNSNVNDVILPAEYPELSL